MNDTIILAGYGGWGMVWLPLVLGLLIVVLGILLDIHLEKQGFIAIAAMWLAFIGGGLWFLVGFGGPSSQWDHQQRVQAISNLGYENIQVDDNKFTASEGGIYKSGAFVQIEGDEWLILEAK